jgi:DNA repair protein RecO
MSHHIHTTEGIVLKRFPDDTDCFYIIFTRELGLVRCYAQGVRKIDSKLRFGLQEYCILDVSFVRGKGGWRITGALPISSLYTESAGEANIKVICNIISVIVRLVSGEEKNENLYESLVSGFRQISKSEKDNLKLYELLCIFRVMYFLGYIDKSGFPDALISTDCFDKETIDYVRDNEKNILTLVNKAIKESQL